MKSVTFIFSVLLLIKGYLSQDVPNDNKYLVKVMDSVGYSSENWVISPASIRSALEQLYIGSGGNTKSQLGSVLNITNDFDIYKEQSKLSVTPGDGVVWKSANRIVVKDTFPLKSSYLSRLSSIFHTDVITSNFEDPGSLAESVNSWVSDHTDGYIKKIVDPESFSGDEDLLILNAVFFKGIWKYAFNHDETQTRCFNAKPGDCKQINMMKQRNKFHYNQFDDLGAQVIQLPYNASGGQVSYSMVIVLPTKQDGLSSVVNKMSKNKLLESVDLLYEEDVLITMPKFTTSFNVNMNKPLQKMGLTSLFSNGADFSGISNVTGLYVSEVYHKAFIDVEEKGTIASAATVVQTNGRLPSPPSPVVTFNANHAFLYFILMDNAQVLFSGQFTGI